MGEIIILVLAAIVGNVALALEGRKKGEKNSLVKKDSFYNKKMASFPVNKAEQFSKNLTSELTNQVEQHTAWYPDAKFNINLNINIKDSFNTQIIKDSFKTTEISDNIKITKDSHNTDSRKWEYQDNKSYYTDNSKNLTSLNDFSNKINYFLKDSSVGQINSTDIKKILLRHANNLLSASK